MVSFPKFDPDSGSPSTSLLSSPLKNRGKKQLKYAIKSHLRNRSTIKLVRLNEQMLANSFVTFKPLPSHFFPADIARAKEREEKALRLALKKRGKKRNAKYGMGNALPGEENDANTSAEQSQIPNSISDMLNEVDEIGMFVKNSENLISVQVSELREDMQHSRQFN